ncbi:MAG: hypothetical protein LIP01_00765, partial [Tannerellaceae bacterium]|nr:hypothetical protein [Tannerellaceae bacterium]
NLLGLTIAFAAFMLIMMQVDYDYNHNKHIKGAESIFRLEMILGDEGAQAILSRPLATAFLNPPLT